MEAILAQNMDLPRYPLLSTFRWAISGLAGGIRPGPPSLFRWTGLPGRWREGPAGRGTHPIRLTCRGDDPSFRDSSSPGMLPGSSWKIGPAPRTAMADQLWPRSTEARPRKRRRLASSSGKGEVRNRQSRSKERRVPEPAQRYRRMADLQAPLCIAGQRVVGRQTFRRPKNKRSRAQTRCVEAFDLAQCRS
jgi:hypothetical protein